MSYARAHGTDLGIPADFFETHDVHVHVPEGSIPKDGPSAGITMAAAMISAFTHRKVRRDVAMTGEITLRGEVLPIGGVKEKVLAARQAKFTTVILPKLNRRDVLQIGPKILHGIVFRYVENPNGSLDDIAGIANAGGNVVGLMPHPERASDAVLGSADGVVLLRSLLAAAAARSTLVAR